MTDRQIRWAGFVNARDLGGLPLAGGGTTRAGALARSADPRLVTAAGWQAAYDAGFRTVVDLRNDDEAEPGQIPAVTLGAGTFAVPAAVATAARPAGMRSVRVPLDDIADTAFWRWLNDEGLNGTPLYFAPFLAAKGRHVAAALTVIARAGPGGVIFHCGGGRDRAGLVSVVILALAGVTPEAVTADYELSSGQVGPLLAALGVTQPEADVPAQVAERGTTVSGEIRRLLAGLDAVRYLATNGMSAADITALRERLVPAVTRPAG